MFSLGLQKKTWPKFKKAKTRIAYLQYLNKYQHRNIMQRNINSNKITNFDLNS